jgi:selenium-binding protein 1
VWTLGIKGVADGNDSMVTVDANPKVAELRQDRPPRAGAGPARGAPRGLHRRPPLPVGGRGSTPARSSSSMSATDPRSAQAREDNLHLRQGHGGLVGPTPSTRCPVACYHRPSNAQDAPAAPASPDTARRQVHPDHLDAKEGPYGYDVRVNANLTACSPALRGQEEQHAPFGELTQTREQMKQFGDSVVRWDFHARKPLQSCACRPLL